MHVNEIRQIPMNFEHYMNSMVHPVTGCTLTSYKKLMHNPTTAEIWQTTFSKDFGGMAQGCNKIGQKGTNAMFVMTHDEIRHALVVIFFSHTQIQLSTTALKRMTPTAFGSQLGAIYSIMTPTHLLAQRTWIQKNYTGTVWSALQMQGTCASTLKIFTSPRPWNSLNA
jgi:hypothetical protein